MSGIVLEKTEFAYLLATLHATSIVGIDDVELFPADKEARDSTYVAGLKSLQEHGWLKPIPQQPGQQNLDDTLLLMTAVIADPQYVIFTVRHSSGDNQQILLHYLAEPDIVELSATPEGKYRLGVVPDRLAMLRRIQEMLGLPETSGAASVQFTIEEQAFLTVQDLAEHGQRDQAAALLKERGINGNNGDSLLTALQSADSGNLVVVVRPRSGEIVAGRKATVFRQKDLTWLTRRVDAESNTLKVETVQADTLPNVLSSYIQFLAK